MELAMKTNLSLEQRVAKLEAITKHRFKKYEFLEQEDVPCEQILSAVQDKCENLPGCDEFELTSDSLSFTRVDGGDTYKIEAVCNEGIVVTFCIVYCTKHEDENDERYENESQNEIAVLIEREDSSFERDVNKVCTAIKKLVRLAR